MKKSELKKILDKYDSEKGYLRSNLYGDSEEITKIREIYHSPLLSNLGPDDNIPLTEVLKLHGIAKDPNRPGSQTFIAMNSINEAIKDDLPQAEKQYNAFIKAKEEIKLLRGIINGALAELEKREKTFNSRAITIESIKLELDLTNNLENEMHKKLDGIETWNDYSKFLQSHFTFSGPVMIFPDIPDSHLKESLEKAMSSVLKNASGFSEKNRVFREPLNKLKQEDDNRKYLKQMDREEKNKHRAAALTNQLHNQDKPKETSETKPKDKKVEKVGGPKP